MAPEENGQKGSPKWMVTFGDACTLLLTFFVLMMTFSGPEDEEFERLAAGLAAGLDSFGVYRSREPRESLTEREKRLLKARMDTGASRLPEKYARLTADEMRKFHEDIDVDVDPEEMEAVLIRVPVELLFDEGVNLSRRGIEILEKSAELTRARSYSIAVRVKTAERSTELALEIISSLSPKVSDDTREIGLSSDFDPERPLEEGECLILMLEV